MEHQVGCHNYKLKSNKRDFFKLPNTEQKYLEFSTDSSFWPFLRDKLSVSVFGQITGYRIYTVSREPIRLPEIPYPVVGLTSINEMLYNLKLGLHKFSIKKTPKNPPLSFSSV